MTELERLNIDGLQFEVISELKSAMHKHGSMHSAHEGYAVIAEEFEELWEEIKLKKPSKTRMREEALQVAAMALRFIVDVCDKVED